jgi:endoglucanase
MTVHPVNMTRSTRAVTATAVSCLIAIALLHAAQPSAAEVLEDFNRPFLFSYLSWQNKVLTTNGVALLRGFNNQGGAGFNGEWDLAGKAALVPALRLKVGPANQSGALILLLKDQGEGEGRWEFPLASAAANGGFVTVFPRESSSLTEPNAVGNGGKPDLAKLRQLQLVGDWANATPVDVEVDAVLLLPPTPEILASRVEREKRVAAEAEARRQERAALQAKYGNRSDQSPTIEHVSAVAPDVLAIEVQAGRLLPARLIRYEPQPSDKKQEKKNASGEVETIELERNGRLFGWLIGPKRDWLTTCEGIQGDPLLDFLADEASSYSVSSPDDPAFASPVMPASVGRKSHVNGWAQGPATVAVRHTLYLRLPKPLTPGKSYSMNLGGLNTQSARGELAFVPTHVRSEAVHVNQIGYRPDDPMKRAFVSCWMGTGGSLTLPEVLNFALVDDASSKVVFQGKGERHFPADKAELMAREVNFNGTDVARCDFSTFTTSGRYRVVVEGVGCSYPFDIQPDVWRKAFLTQMRGLYHQRSGVELGPPYTNYRKPRDMNPADGYQVTKTRYRAVEHGGEAWKEIPGGDTGEAVPQGWGGYHDAGDWNPRRVTHLRATMATLEMLDLFPDTFAALKLNIPPTPGLPDILTEALFEFDCFMRLQQPNGGVPYGMESKGDPASGEVSWLNSFPSYVLAGDYAASWYYAAVGARLARLLAPYDAKRAAAIRESAVRAFAFGDQDYARDRAAGLTAQRPSTWQAVDDRNLAALELYRLTRDTKYHLVFFEDSVLRDAKPELFAWGTHIQREQAFQYARLPEGWGDAALKKKAVTALCEMADRALRYAEGNAFNVTSPDKGKPQFIGFYATPDATDLTRAHHLTGDPRYLAGAVQATQFQSGCNPNNLVYMTGLGANPVKNVFKLDARRTGQPVPEGLVPYGNIDFAKWNDNGVIWPIIWVIGKATVPSAYDWPTHQAYWDLGGWPMLEEFTVDRWEPNLLVWGYLAARQ